MNLVFTSAGDNTDFHRLWCGNGQRYHLVVYYYGESKDRFECYDAIAEYAVSRKGAKYQNFRHFHSNHRDMLSRYDRVMILDDDIQIDVAGINRVFELSREYDLDICQPAFENTCKISHDITRQRSDCLLRYTNFVETGVACFSRPALERLMQWLDQSLIGWGIDYLSIWANGVCRENAYAILDAVPCVNPHDRDKRSTRRELSLVANYRNDYAVWSEYAKGIGCPVEWTNREYSRVPSTVGGGKMTPGRSPDHGLNYEPRQQTTSAVDLCEAEA